MSKIKGKDLLRLGFVKEKNTPFNAMDSEYHYYVFESKDGKGVLISNTNDEKTNGGYEVELYEVQGITFRKLGQLKKLVKLLKKASNE